MEGGVAPDGLDGGRVPSGPPQVHGCVPFERGEFAVAATDMGHRDPSAASWGGDPERWLDFAHRAQHPTARAALTRTERRHA